MSRIEGWGASSTFLGTSLLFFKREDKSCSSFFEASSPFLNPSFSSIKREDKGCSSFLGASHFLETSFSSLPLSSLLLSSFSFSFASSQVHFTRSSVSGLGMSTPGATSNSRPANHSEPNTYCTGSDFSNRCMIFSSRVVSSADNCVTLPKQMSVSDMPNRASSTVRTMAWASRSLYMAVSRFHNWLYVMPQN